jgi:5-methylcytosine-specific restriction protein B
MISADKDLGDGFMIGHSFFCTNSNDVQIDDEWYNTIVTTELAPLIKEYWFDKKPQEIELLVQKLRDPD